MGIGAKMDGPLFEKRFAKGASVKTATVAPWAAPVSVLRGRRLTFRGQLSGE